MDYFFYGDIFYFLEIFLADCSNIVSNNDIFNKTSRCINYVAVGGGLSDILEAIFWVGGVECITGVSYKHIWVFQIFWIFGKWNGLTVYTH